MSDEKAEAFSSASFSSPSIAACQVCMELFMLFEVEVRLWVSPDTPWFILLEPGLEMPQREKVFEKEALGEITHADEVPASAP